MKKCLLFLGFSLAAALPITSVKAQSFLEVVNGSAAFTTTGSSQVIGRGVDFLVGRLRLSLDSGQQAFISYTFEGAEGVPHNQFFGPGQFSMMDNQASVGTMITTRINAGLLDFSFRSPSGASASNAQNYAWNDANIGIVLARDRLSGHLLFEDGQGRLGSDHDYDDMVVGFKVSVTPVPEASSVAMLLAGVGALAALLRRRARRD